MKMPQYCIYCGEPIVERGNTLSRDPDLCASCSSLSDGMTGADGFEWADLSPNESVDADTPQPFPKAA